MKNILIIGCGLLGSSLLRRIRKKKIAKHVLKNHLGPMISLHWPGHAGDLR